MKLFIGTDHSGYELKDFLLDELLHIDIETIDCGAFSLDPGDDYPTITKKVADSVMSESQAYGVMIGGSGQGEAIAANKVPGIRCAIFYGPVVAKSAIDIDGTSSDDPYEIVRLARRHNNANMLAISARFTTKEEALKAIEVFINTPFEAEDRHVRRISMLM